MKDKLKLKTNLPILILVSVITCYLVVKDSVHDVNGIISSCNLLFLFLAFISVMLGDLFKSFSVYIIAKDSETNLSFKESYSLQLETNFFNGVTPFALGGQPFQLYILKHKNKIPYLKGTNIIFCDYYSFQIVLLFWVIILFMLNCIFNFIKLNAVMNTFLLFGFIIHIVVFFVLEYATRSKHNKTAIKLIHLLSKFHLIKDEEKAKTNAVKRLNELKKLINGFKKDRSLLIKSVILNSLKLLFHSLSIYFVFLSIGININPITAIIVGVYVWVMSSFIPIPGATGGMEYSFITLFETMLTSGIVASAVILWRFITYYFMVIVGAIIFIIVNKKIKKTD